MATLVCFHAHPDDEAIATGGVMAKANAEGHRVVLVLATRGEHGEPREGVLEEGEALGDRRMREAHASAAVLGVHRVEFLGYLDSGMMGEPSNDDPHAFWQADVEEAAATLAAVLVEEHADVLTVYDHHGGYGHPDHIQVHRVGLRAAEMARVDHVFEATMNQDAINRQIRENKARIEADGGDFDFPEMSDEVDFGEPEANITHAVDVSAFVQIKRDSMKCHASQISEEDFFLQMPEDVFAGAFGTEWFIHHGHARAEGEPFTDSLL